MPKKYMPAAMAGAASGFATLDATGKVPSSQLPAGSGAPDWADITNKPATFPPSTHTHAPSDVTGTAVITTDARLSDARTPTAHTHDYTTGVTGKPSTFAPSAHTHPASDLTTFRPFAAATSANVALTASTTVNLTALDLAVAGVETWVLDYGIPVTVSGGTAGVKPIFTLPASSTGSMMIVGTTSALTGSTSFYSTTPGTASATGFVTASLTGAYVWVRARIVTGGAGTIRIGVATGASAAGNLLAGASVTAVKI